MEPFYRLDLEIYTGHEWRRIGQVELIGSESKGVNAATEFSYDLDYALSFSERKDYRAVSCLAPVSFEPMSFPGWPPFLLDLFPQGAAMRYIVDHYRLADQPQNYWKIIKTAQLNPPGNLRVVTAALEREVATFHPGFTRAEVMAKGADFLEYMVMHGAPVAGTTGAAGAAPKFLLREDVQGRFHADSTLSDKLTKTCWLVKFPRGKTEVDQDILRAEKAYMDIAKYLGFSVYSSLDWQQNCLFIPRFERPYKNGQFAYLGLESFYSLVGLPEFGSRLLHETYLTALARFSTDAVNDTIEYVLRDFLNVMMGNTDNHGRNSSVLKGDGWVGLAPLYDFAPMKFDPEGIVRNTRWGSETAEGDILAIVKFLEEKCGVERYRFDERLTQFYRQASQLETLMYQHQIPKKFIEQTATERQQRLRDIGHYLEQGR